MGQAVQLKQQEYIDLQGIPVGFWSGNEWSVMTLVKFHDDGKENPVLGDGTPAMNQGFHLGLKDKVSPYQYKDYIISNIVCKITSCFPQNQESFVITDHDQIPGQNNFQSCVSLHRLLSMC